MTLLWIFSHQINPLRRLPENPVDDLLLDVQDMKGNLQGRLTLHVASISDDPVRQLEQPQISNANMQGHVGSFFLECCFWSYFFQFVEVSWCELCRAIGCGGTTSTVSLNMNWWAKCNCSSATPSRLVKWILPRCDHPRCAQYANKKDNPVVYTHVLVVLS